MENEDGTKGPHWTVEETTSVANQMGINLKSEKHNKWDWYVAMNMIYSDYYKAVVAMTGSANTKHFAELAKAWLCDKDIDEGKMWHYYVYLMCDDDENDYKAYERMMVVIAIVVQSMNIVWVEKEGMTMRLEAINILTLDMIEKN